MRTSLVKQPLDWWRSLDRVQRGFLLLALARVVIAALFMANIPPLDLRAGWYLHHGGDQDEYLTLARSIVEGAPRRSVVGLGQALVMIPWVMLLRPAQYMDIVAPLVIINGFILGGLSVLMVGGLARKITGRDGIAVFTALVWAFLPTLAYYGWFWHFDPAIMRSSYVPVAGWLNGLSDGPSVFALLAAAYLLARGVDEEKMPSWRALGVGIAIGVSVTFRVHVALMGAFLVFYMLIAHGGRALGLTLLGAAIAYLPQAWYNMAVFHFPVATGYISVYSDNWAHTLWMLRYNLPFHPRHWLELWQYHVARRMWVLIPFAGFLALGLAAIAALWRRRGWRAMMLLFGAPLAYLIPMSAAWPFRDDVIRFSLPALPFLIIIGVAAPAVIWQWARCIGLRRARPLDIPSQE